MPLPEHIGKPKPLEHVIEHLADLPPWSWLYIPAATHNISLAVLCFPQTIDSRNLSESEADDFEAAIAGAGLKSFFCRSQLEEIVSNLQQQKPSYSMANLEAAIDF